MIEEELQRRIKEFEVQDQCDKQKKSPKVHKKKTEASTVQHESDSEELQQASLVNSQTNVASNGTSNGTSNGNHKENGQNGNAAKHET